MTREEYDERVKDAATTLLTTTEAKEWKEENPNGSFYDFVDVVNWNDSLHGVIDSTCATNWKEAVKVLQVSSQNPDHVDSGLYEGCSWKQILVTIAFEVYSWDVNETAQDMYDSNEFGEYLMPIETNTRQIGHFPELQGYKIPIGPWAIAMHDAIKISMGAHQLSVVFEGKVENRAQAYVVMAKRVYTQGDDNASIQDDLKRCMEEYGVRLFPARRATPKRNAKKHPTSSA